MNKKLFLDLIKKFGTGSVLGAATLDGNRRTVLNDSTNKKLDEAKAALSALSEEKKKIVEENIASKLAETKVAPSFSSFKENAESHKNPSSEHYKDELEKANSKLKDAWDNIDKLSFTDGFTS